MRKTRKYLEAQTVVSRGGIVPVGWKYLPHEELYEALQKAGFFWNAQTKVWDEHDIADADEPTPLIMVRVWADAEIVEEAADDIVKQTKHFLTRWQLVERSRPYPCRPPKQREARVYLKFLPKGVQS